ncbi:DUF3106 domain-containing protein [Marilutibacter alkalisoli]|nr:DUF3106 domain-containing protein [Lysobacter alkalisoli]
MRRSLALPGLVLAAGVAAMVPPLPGAVDGQSVDGGLAEARPAEDAIVTPVSLDGLPEAVSRLLQQLPDENARRLRRHATLWQGWTPAMRAAFAERASEWDALPAAQRAARRETWQALQALPQAQREQVVGMAREFAHKPQVEQDALRQRFAGLEPGARRGWLLGPVLGADYPTLHPLLAQLPAGQHAPLMAVLQSMTAAQRVQLGVLVQRTPPQDRDALRLELIATPPERRQHWLWEQLDR